MIETFSQTLVQTMRLFVIMAIGFGLNKSHILPASAKDVLSKLVTFVSLPMLTMNTFITQCTVEKLTANGSLLLYGGGMTLLLLLLSYPLSHFFAKDPYDQAIYRYAITVPNTGAFCTPLVLAFFGYEGYFQDQLLVFTQAMLVYSWGLIQLQPTDQRASARQTLKKLINPCTIGMAAGIILGLAGGSDWIPQIVLDNIRGFGDMYVPLSLLLLGFAIADFPFKDILPDGKLIIFTVFRMILLPIVYVLLMKLLGAPTIVILLTSIIFACPCGMNTVVYPLAFGKDCKKGASMILFTSLLAFITMPLIYSFGMLMS